MVGRLLSFWEGLFSGAMLVLGRVCHVSFPGCNSPIQNVQLLFFGSGFPSIHHGVCTVRFAKVWWLSFAESVFLFDKVVVARDNRVQIGMEDSPCKHVQTP